MELNNMSEEELKREKLFIYWLCQVPCLGSIKIQNLYLRYQSFERIYHIEETQFIKDKILTERQAAALSQSRQEFKRYYQEYLDLYKKKIRFMTFLDSDYPERLKNIYDFPIGLYIKGRLPEDDRPSAAVIGARGCTAYGIQIAEMISRRLAKSGVQIISGLALGIDGAGHRGALEAGGQTFAILGCGVDVCYPRENISLYSDIPERGGIISEFPLKSSPSAQHFPMRNRIISGFSDAVVVVEARIRSGSLITVDLALEQGKEVFAVPGNMTQSLSEGCNQLIAQGARIVTSVDDILDFFDLTSEGSGDETAKIMMGLAKNEKMVYSFLDFQPKYIDQIVRECGLSFTEVLEILFALESKGFIIQPMNHYYSKKLN